MTFLSLHNVSKAFGNKVILDGVSFTLEAGDRVGLVGANGSGKSTIVKIVVGSVDFDGGAVTLTEGVDVGYLPQTPEYRERETIAGWIERAQSQLLAIEKRMEVLSERMSIEEGPALEQVMSEYGEWSARFEQRGGYEIAYRTETVLGGLGIAHLDRGRLVSTLSGGEKTRLGLAALLIRAPDLLLLDEPTNHLDFATMDWLEQYISNYRGAVLIVSHDRQFLNQTVTTIFEMNEYDHQVTAYSGNYDAYVEQRRIARLQWQGRYEAQQEEIQQLQTRLRETARQFGHHRPPRDNEKYGYNAKAHNVEKTVSRNVRAAQVQLDRMMANPIPKPPEPLEFCADLHAERTHNPMAISASRVKVFSENNQEILREVQITLGRGERVLIVGPNGAGKSTLLDVMAGVRQADEGEVRVPPDTIIGYLRQELVCENPSATVLDEFRAGLSGEREELIARLLSYQLFRFEEFELAVGTLSPGQQRKLMLAKLMAMNPNLLLIDEPTNHVSFDILEGFERALDTFTGSLIVVSHDRWFIQRFRGSVWTMKHGVLTPPPRAKLTSEDEQRMVDEIVQISQYPIVPPKTKD